MPRQSQWAVRLSEVARADGVDHFALVALVDEEIVGVARADRTAVPKEVEFALLIEDAWQQRGLGKRLLARLVEEVRRSQRVCTFTATILAENQRALRLVTALFASVQRQRYGREFLIRAPIATLTLPSRNGCAPRLIGDPHSPRANSQNAPDMHGQMPQRELDDLQFPPLGPDVTSQR